ncbi:MAG: gliding motility-associated C-terminal domain-containing protein [Bacteroidales bacterium]|nr:gliding motility-associated C-terminal domain-containing protein [Bacteroidales bacterium]HOY39731.1 PKD domain-containing protein [Bacteroidales bacterium]
MKRISGIIIIILLLGILGNLKAQTYLISQGGTITTCSGTLYDSGGANGEYGTYEDYTITICSSTGGSISLLFTVFQLESATYDHLSIYDGPNTSANDIIYHAGGSTLLNQEITGSGNCLTLVWHTDGSVTYPGFAATISCTYPCQDYTIDIVSSNPPQSPPADSLWVDVCQGETVTFTATADFSNNNVDYNQTLANTTWYWTVVSEAGTEDLGGLGQNTLTYTFTNEGGYYINLQTVDMNGCTQILNDYWRVRASLTPDFTVTHPATVCPGETFDLTGTASVDPWVLQIPEVAFIEVCFEDVVGVDQEQCFVHSAFAPGQFITAASDVESICMNMEHSYMGDLDIWIECPNGQTANLFEQACGGTYFGEANDNDDCVPGVGWNYCWSMSGSSLMSANCYTGSSLPAGTYLPVGSFSSLIGCPLNGEWCIHFLDNLSIDDGNVFTVELHFADYLIPSAENMWTYTTTYNTSPTSTDLEWTGEGVGANTGGVTTASSLTPGSQPFTFSATDNLGCTYDTTVYVTVLPFNDPTCCVFPDPNAGNDDQVCSNSYTFNGTITQGNTANWTLVSGPGTGTWTNQTSPAATVTVSAYGTYVFQLYEQNLSPSCSATDQVTIVFLENPQSTFTVTTIPCFGGNTTVTYTGNAQSTATYNWNFNGAQVISGSGAGPYVLSWTTAGAHPVSLQVVQDGCTSTNTTNSVMMPAVLSHVLTTHNDPCYQSCQGNASVLVTGGTAPYTYSWASGNNYLPNLCAGNYAITVTDANGCTTVESFSISEPTQMVMTSYQTTNLSCYNAADGAIAVVAQGGTGNLMYIWSDIGVGEPTRVGMSAGNYSLTIMDENNCQLVEFFQLTQPDELLLTISNSLSICEWQTAHIVAQHMGGTAPYSFFWDTGTGYEIGPNELNTVPHQTTTYNVYVQDGNGCKSNTASMTVTVSPELIIDTILLQHNRCFQSCDGRAELQITGGIPPLQYSWGSADNVLAGLCAGIYTVTVTDEIGCTINDVFTITQPDEITYTLNTVPASCYNYNDGEATIYVQGGVLPYTYLWPDGDTDMTMLNHSGVYIVTVTDDHNCRIEVPITITQPDDILLISSDDKQICIGQNAILSAQAVGGVPYYSFLWQGTDGSTFPTASITVNPDVTTEYSVTVTDSHGCMGNVGLVRVNVYPPLTITDIVTSYDTVCPGEPAIIEVDAAGGNGGPYMLLLEDGSVVPSPFTVYPQVTTMYYVTLMDACGSPSAVDSIKINVYPAPPNLFVSDRVSGCPGVAINFTELNSVNSLSYLWNFGDNGYSIEKNPAHIYTEPGVYSVSLTTRTSFGCSTTQTIPYMITIFENPVASFTVTPEIVSVLDGDVFFENLSSLADSVYWFFGDGDSSIYYSPWHRYEQIGNYEIMLIVATEHGCTDTTFRNVVVNGEFSFYAPTMFTPNGDGKNDCFRICGNGIDANTFYMMIYDRWGNKVFETETYNPNVICKSCAEGSWDGTNKGDVDKGDTILENGVYTWYCEFKDWHGTIYHKTGNVHLVR